MFIVIVPLLRALANHPKVGTNISLRLNQLADSIMRMDSSGTDIESRMETYLTSINAFFRHPLFGIGNAESQLNNYGQHSTILDALAQFGLVGGIPYLWFHIAPIKEMNKHMFDNERKVMSIGFFLLFLLGLINRANTRPDFAIIFIVLPQMVQVNYYSNRSN